MQVGMWDVLFNLAALLFWFRLWAVEDRTFFNPYVSPLLRVADRVADVGKSLSFGHRPRTTAAAAILLLVALRPLFFLLLGRLGRGDGQTVIYWPLEFGFHGRGPVGAIPWLLLLSAFSFAAALFNVWGISLLYLHRNRNHRLDHTEEMLDLACRPFSDLPLRLRPLVLLAFGMFLASLLGSSAAPAYWRSLVLPASLLKLALSALLAWVNVLPMIANAMILLIIGSWVALFAQSESVHAFCHDWLDLLVGPLRRYPIRLGFLDLTAIVFLALLGYVVYPALVKILGIAYGRLP